MDYYVYLVLAKTFKVGDRVALLERNSRPTLLLTAVGEDVVLLSDLQQVKTRRICPETSQQQVDFTVKMTRRQNSLADLQYRALSVGRSAIVASDMKVRLWQRSTAGSPKGGKALCYFFRPRSISELLSMHASTLFGI